MRNIESLKRDIDFQKEQLNLSLDEEYFKTVCELRQVRISRESTKCRDRMKKKIDAILRKRDSHTIDERWVVNLSSRDLTTPQKSILSKGLSFAPAPRKIPIPMIMMNKYHGLNTRAQGAGEYIRRKNKNNNNNRTRNS